LTDYLDLEEIVKDEIVQRIQEGCEVSRIKQKLLSMKKKGDDELEALLKELERLSPNADFPFVEPSTLHEIKAARPKGPRKMEFELSDDELYDRIHGAWLGRCAGCLLGKPAEGWTRWKIEEYLKLAGAYPLQNYFPIVIPVPEGYPASLAQNKCMLGNIEYVVRDDDIDYTILGLHILETYGPNFTTEDLGEEWLTHLPYKLVYTAERNAYRNLVNGILSPYSATHRNPYREWIGAQIRADIWGYVTPGMPELGAELAHRDAALSHVKNGIYSEMFVSAMISAASATDNMEEVIKVGLSEIPKRSRLAEAIKDTVTWSKEFTHWREAWNKVMEKYGHYPSVHTINNAVIVLLGLLYGEKDYEKSITISVMGGLDTDCNGATTGSIVGAMLGAETLPEKWTRPLNDRIESYVAGFNDCRISDLAQRTFSVMKKVQKEMQSK